MSRQLSPMRATIPVQREDWMQHGACRGMDPVTADKIFFPGRGESTAEAKAICADCPVRVECLDYAMRRSNSWMTGIFGGLSARERRRLWPATEREATDERRLSTERGRP